MGEICVVVYQSGGEPHLSVSLSQKFRLFAVLSYSSNYFPPRPQLRNPTVLRILNPADPWFCGASGIVKYSGDSQAANLAMNSFLL
jgi:hypothetical protein